MKEKTATATIYEVDEVYNIKVNGFNAYNKYAVPKCALWLEMNDLADLFNNVLEIGILFELG